jgi:hypothetical protein
VSGVRGGSVEKVDVQCRYGYDICVESERKGRCIVFWGVERISVEEGMQKVKGKQIRERVK